MCNVRIWCFSLCYINNSEKSLCVRLGRLVFVGPCEDRRRIYCVYMEAKDQLKLLWPWGRHRNDKCASFYRTSSTWTVLSGWVASVSFLCLYLYYSFFNASLWTGEILRLQIYLTFIAVNDVIALHRGYTEIIWSF